MSEPLNAAGSRRSLSQLAANSRSFHDASSPQRSAVFGSHYMPNNDPQWGSVSPSVVTPPSWDEVGPVPLPQLAGDGVGWCGMAIPPKDVIPGNLHALIPSKFKYKFPRERIPRHKSYEVLAVEDNPNAPPLAPVPPKKPHKKKSIFGIAKRSQHMSKPFDSGMRSSENPNAESSNGSEVGGQRGWVRDFKCFLCTSTDFVSEEQVQLELENAQLDEALAEYQDNTRIQAIQLLETRKSYEQRLRENEKTNEDATRDIQTTKAALDKIQAERDQLLLQQRQTDLSLALIRERVDSAVNTIFQSQSEISEEIIEQMRSFCLGVTDMINRALPAERAPSPSTPSPLSRRPEVILCPEPEPPTPALPRPSKTKRGLKKKGMKPKVKKGKKVLKKKGKKAASKGKARKPKKVTKKSRALKPRKHQSSPKATEQAFSSIGGEVDVQEAPEFPFSLPVNVAGHESQGALGSLKFVLYPGIRDT